MLGKRRFKILELMEEDSKLSTIDSDNLWGVIQVSESKVVTKSIIPTVHQCDVSTEEFCQYRRSSCCNMREYMVRVNHNHETQPRVSVHSNVDSQSHAFHSECFFTQPVETKVQIKEIVKNSSCTRNNLTLDEVFCSGKTVQNDTNLIPIHKAKSTLISKGEKSMNKEFQEFSQWMEEKSNENELKRLKTGQMTMVDSRLIKEGKEEQLPSYLNAQQTALGNTSVIADSGLTLLEPREGYHLKAKSLLEVESPIRKVLIKSISEQAEAVEEDGHLFATVRFREKGKLIYKSIFETPSNIHHPNNYVNVDGESEVQIKECLQEKQKESLSSILGPSSSAGNGNCGIQAQASSTLNHFNSVSRRFTKHEEGAPVLSNNMVAKEELTDNSNFAGVETIQVEPCDEKSEEVNLPEISMENASVFKVLGASVVIDNLQLLPSPLASVAGNPEDQITSNDTPKSSINLLCKGDSNDIALVRKSVHACEVEGLSSFDDFTKVNQVLLETKPLEKRTENEISSNVSLFSTASGKFVGMASLESLSRARRVLEGSSNFQSEAKRNSPNLSLFSTASGKPVSIATQGSVERANILLEGNLPVEKAENRNSPTCSLFSTASGKVVEISSSKALAQARSLLAGTSISQGKSEVLGSNTSFFSTASGKPVDSSSKTALLRATSFLEGKRTVQEEQEPSADFSVVTTTAGKSMEVSSNTVPHAMNALGGTSNFQTEPAVFSTTSLFSTASGKPVNIASEESLLKAKSFFEEKSFMQMTDGQPTPNSSFFSTASGKAVEMPSSGSLLHAENLLTGPLSQVKQTPTCISPSLFSTASGKGVDMPTPNALIHAKSLFEESNSGTAKTPETLGSVAGGKTAEIYSGQYFPRSQTLLMSSSSEIPTPCSNSRPISITPKVKKSKSRLLAGTFVSQKNLSNSFSRQKRFQSPRMASLHSSVITTPPSSNPSAFLPSLSSGATHSDFTKLEKGPLHNLFKDSGPRCRMQEFLNDNWGRASKGPPFDVMSVRASTAAKWRMKDADGSVFGPPEARMKLLGAGADPKQATLQWVENHWRWIIWKLASYQRNFPEKWGPQGLLTRERLMDQLKYRYEREVGQGHRSALRRVLERDSGASLPMCLCLGWVQDHGALKEASGPPLLELTDGWYSVKARLDGPLSRLNEQGKLFEGQKLFVQGGALEGCEEALPPLEAYPLVTLRLHLNGTRRAPWWEKLGFYRSTLPPLSLSSVHSEGGLVPSCLVVLNRKYPLLFCERETQGRSVVRTQRAEEEAREEFMKRYTYVCEDATLNCADNWTSQLKRQRQRTEAGRLLEAVEQCAEPEEFFQTLTHQQQVAITRQREEEKRQLSVAMEKATTKALKEEGLIERQVSAMLRLRVSEVSTCDSSKSEAIQEAMVTVWRPTQEHMDSLEEGTVYLVTDLLPRDGSLSTGCTLNFTSTKRSLWRKICPSLSTNLRIPFYPRTYLTVKNLKDFPEQRQEFDLMATVVHIEHPAFEGHRKYQWVFLADCAGLEDFHQGEVLALQLIGVPDTLPIFDSEALGRQLSFKNLLKKRFDKANMLLVGEGSDYTVVQRFEQAHGERVSLELLESTVARIKAIISPK